MFMEDAILTEDTDQRRIEHVVSLKFDIILCHVSCINPLDGRLAELRMDCGGRVTYYGILLEKGENLSIFIVMHLSLCK